MERKFDSSLALVSGIHALLLKRKTDPLSRLVSLSVSLLRSEILLVCDLSYKHLAPLERRQRERAQATLPDL